jgi:FAD dependent oxidoreductase
MASRSREYGRKFDTKAERATPTFFDRYFLPSSYNPAWGAWPIQYHSEPGQPTVWRTVHENNTYDIPLRTLCSKDTPNLFVGGRLTDGDSYGGGSVRVMESLSGQDMGLVWRPQSMRNHRKVITFLFRESLCVRMRHLKLLEAGARTHATHAKNPGTTAKLLICLFRL